MNSKLNIPSRISLALLLLLLNCSSSSNAFNITEILSQHSDFSSFSDALSQTQVASAINSRQTLTVLALDNSAMSGVSGSQSQDTLRAILSLHVILDYFDPAKLQNMPQKSTILTTLYQTSGQAVGMQGFLNVTITNGGVMIGSAVPGSSLGSSLVKSVASQPYNISVLQISSAIVPPNIGGQGNSSSLPPSPLPGGSSPPPSGASSPPGPSPRSSPIIPLPPKFGNAPVPSAAKTPTAAPPNAGVTPPSNASAMPPSGGAATPPANAMAPSGGAATPPAGATAPSDASAAPPAGATAPSDAGATTPAGATAPSNAGANSPAGGAMPIVPGDPLNGSPPMPAGAGPIAYSPVADAPTGGSSESGRSYHSLDHASVLITSIAIIWSVALSI